MKYFSCAATSVVYVFDVVPKSHQLSGAVDKGGAATKSSEGVGLPDRLKVQLLSANSTVIDIFSNADTSNTVLLVSMACVEGILFGLPRTRNLISPSLLGYFCNSCYILQVILAIRLH